MAFSEVREYQPGDDVRAIDWNVTARYNHPYIKVFEEERELTVILLVDVSASESFGTQKQLKMDLVTEIYKLTEKFPKSEIYGLSRQMQRAAVAIPSNIAEGQKRGHPKEFLQFLYISYGSGAELETQIEISKRLPKLKDFDYRIWNSLFF